ncbi:HAD family hydrolase [Collimonas sp. NPDC087041]|uniref:HAD family hydrolase n=1 Tax=Collimonas sp. NPDC087041 TaxID=3363960 RepID=UPI003818AD37
MYKNNKRLIILDADGTTIDAYSAIDKTFSRHGMEIGDEERFQKRRRLFKYLGGLKEFPSNLKKQIGKQSRKLLIATLTEVYREEALLYPGIASLVQSLIAAPDVVVGLVTRNVTNQPEETLRQLFRRHDIDLDALDFFAHIPTHQEKVQEFRAIRERLDINPARAYICGDEHKDYLSAIGSGMHPFMVSYGFESHKRLIKKFLVPEEIISRSPAELCQRVRHALELLNLN